MPKAIERRASQQGTSTGHIIKAVEAQNSEEQRSQTCAVLRGYQAPLLA